MGWEEDEVLGCALGFLLTTHLLYLLYRPPHIIVDCCYVNINDDATVLNAIISLPDLAGPLKTLLLLRPRRQNRGQRELHITPTYPCD